MTDIRTLKPLAEGDHVLINVPHLGTVSGTVKALTFGEYVATPMVAVLWFTGSIDLIEVERLRSNGRGAWLVKPRTP